MLVSNHQNHNDTHSSSACCKVTTRVTRYRYCRNVKSFSSNQSYRMNKQKFSISSPRPSKRVDASIQPLSHFHLIRHGVVICKNRAP